LITENLIPFEGLSTGTKGLLLTLLPLIELNTDNSIIIIDEPERSLFPDMQVGLMEHYQNIAPKAQFIVATHSPFIAAAFEDYERFILYFDEKGKVKVKKGKSPIGDDPNDILHNDFNVDYYNKDGKKAYQDYLDLKKELFKENDNEKKNKLLLKLTAIGDKYNF
jgi:predicted ATP-dependent endonuclease of OLD family